MDEDKLHQEQVRAGSHRLRRTILEVLIDKRTLPELATAIPDAGSTVLPTTSTEAVVAYHLRVLQQAQMVRYDGGGYRVVA